MTVVTEVVIMTPLRKKHLNTLTTTNSRGSFSQLLRCFLFKCLKYKTCRPFLPEDRLLTQQHLLPHRLYLPAMCYLVIYNRLLAELVELAAAACCSMSAAVASAAETFAEASAVAAPWTEAATAFLAGAAALPEAAVLASLALEFLVADVAESLTVSDFAAVPSTSLAVPSVDSDLPSVAVLPSQLAAVVAVPSVAADVAAPSSVSTE